MRAWTLYVIIVLPLVARSLSPALTAIINPHTAIKSTAPVLTTTRRNWASFSRKVVIFPEPHRYCWVEGESGFTSNVKLVDFKSFFPASLTPPPPSFFGAVFSFTGAQVGRCSVAVISSAKTFPEKRIDILKIKRRLRKIMSMIVDRNRKNSKLLNFSLDEYTFSTYFRAVNILLHLFIMRVLFSIFFNGLILYAIVKLLPETIATGDIKLYFIWGVILWLLNTIVRPILSILGFPFMILTFGLFLLVINGIILSLLESIIHALNIAWVSFSTGSFANFAIAVVIFTFFNTLYNVFFKK